MDYVKQTELRVSRVNIGHGDSNCSIIFPVHGPKNNYLLLNLVILWGKCYLMFIYAMWNTWNVSNIFNCEEMAISNNLLRSTSLLANKVAIRLMKSSFDEFVIPKDQYVEN